MVINESMAFCRAQVSDRFEFTLLTLILEQLLKLHQIFNKKSNYLDLILDIYLR